MLTGISSKARGVYVLWLWLPLEQAITVGALGSCHFLPGCYAYVGSAQNGLWHRLHRHSQPTKPLHWHIDYLRAYAELVQVAVIESGPELECQLASALQQHNGAPPVLGFGSSDCKCTSHLFYFPEQPAVLQEPHLLWPTLESVALEALRKPSQDE